MLKQVVGETRRNQFVKALRSLLSLTMLFRDNENSIPQKLAVLESGSIPPRRSAEEDNLMLSKYSSEELGLLEAAFLKGVRSGNTLGAVLSDARQLEAIMLDLSLALSRTEADLLFNFMDRDGNAAIDFNEFAAVVLLPLSGPDTFTPADGQDAAENAANTLFAIIDVSNDGLVTLEEFQTILARVFPSWDPDSLVSEHASHLHACSSHCLPVRRLFLCSLLLLRVFPTRAPTYSSIFLHMLAHRCRCSGRSMRTKAAPSTGPCMCQCAL